MNSLAISRVFLWKNLKMSKLIETQVVNMFKNGRSYKYITHKLNISSSTVSRILKKSGLTSPNKKVSLSEKVEIINLYEEGCSEKYICDTVNRTNKCVRKIISQLPEYTDRKRKRVSLIQEDLICQLYSDLNVRDISVHTGFTESTIYNVLKRNNIKTLSVELASRKYPINEDFFDVIDTQEKAYVLGLLYADGCNLSNTNSVCLSLKAADLHILEEFRDLVSPERPIGVYTSKQCSDSCSLNLASKHVSDQLTKLGCMPQKTHKLQFPNEDQVPKHLIRHFIRGYFDGDGYIGVCKSSPRMSIAGNLEFLKTCQKNIGRGN